MKQKTLLFTITLLVLFLASVSGALAQDLFMDSFSITTVRGATLLDTASSQMLSNGAASNISAISLTVSDLEHVSLSSTISASSITCSPVTIIELSPGGQQEIQCGLSVSPDTDLGEYSGQVTFDYTFEGSDYTQNVPFIVAVENQEPQLDVSNCATNHVLGEEYVCEISVSDEDIVDELTTTLSNQPSSMVLDESTLTISGWTPLSLGTHSFTVTVSDGYAIDSQTIVVDVVTDSAILSFEDDEIVFGDDSTPRGTIVTQQIEIANQGSHNFDDVSAVLQTLGGSPITLVTPIIVSQESLLVDETATITVVYELPEDIDSQKDKFAKLVVSAIDVETAEEIEIELDAYRQAESSLEVDDCEVIVDNDDDSCSTVDVHEGDEIEIELIIENTGSTDIENVYAEIIDDENDWEIDVKSSKKDINNDDDEKVIVTFTVPQEVSSNDEEVTLDIHIYGDDDEYNFEHYTTTSITFILDRDDDDVAITNAEFISPTYISSGLIDLEIELRNRGEDDQDVFSITVENEELGIFETREYTHLNSAENDEYRFTLELPQTLQNTSYVFTITVDYNGEQTVDTVVLDSFMYSESVGIDTTSQPVVEDDSSVVVVDSQYAITQTQYAQSTNNSFRNSVGYLVVLTLLVFALLVGVVTLLLRPEVFFSQHKSTRRSASVVKPVQKASVNKTKKVSTKKATKKTVTSKKATKKRATSKKKASITSPKRHK